jgi:hypothetical protein
MPSRQNKTPRGTGAAGEPHKNARSEKPNKKIQGQLISPARTHTRINAFITSMGRRNQAKRDSR